MGKGWICILYITGKLPPHGMQDECRRKSGSRISSSVKVSSMKASLIQSEKRVFTKLEVMHILRDLLAASEDGPFLPNYEKMEEAMQRHGFSFVNHNGDTRA